MLTRQTPGPELGTHVNKKVVVHVCHPRQHQRGREEHPGVHSPANLAPLVSSRFQNETLLQRTGWLGFKEQCLRLASSLSLYAYEHMNMHAHAHAPTQTYSVILM